MAEGSWLRTAPSKQVLRVRSIHHPPSAIDHQPERAAQRMSKFYIQTYGCQMNVADSDRMTALLERAGGSPVERPEEADLILLNTCSVREKPELKVYSRLGELRKLKRRNPDLLLGVCGCQAQREGETILRNAPYVDLGVGTANVEQVPELVAEVRRTGERLV